MNREIKFRVWSKDLSKWVYPVRDVTMNLNYQEEFIFEQFTGLTDKNGKPIYEGDIVRIHEAEDYCRDEVVIYCGDRDYPAFDFKGWRGESNGLSESKAIYRIEVIGNIHEHKHLIE